MAEPESPDSKKGSTALPEAHPPDTVHGRSIDLSGPPGAPLPPPVELARKPAQHPPLPRSNKPFDPRILVPMDLLDPSLPSTRALKTQQKQARQHRLNIALGIVAAVLAGTLIGAGAIIVAPWFLTKKTAVPEIMVSFSVNSEPPGAAILIDGKQTDLVTPARLRDWDYSLPHQLSLKLNDYFTERREVPAGLHPPDLNVALARLGHLSVRSEPSGASVFVGAEELGVTPNVFDLPADRDLDLSVKAAGHLPISEHLRLKPAEEAQRNFVLHAMARLVINSEPLGARISLDGRAPSIAPLEVELESGVPHHVQASVPGLPTQQQTVTVKDGQRSELRFRFEDPRDRAARGELARVQARLKVAQRQLDVVREKGSSSEFFSTVDRLHKENQLSDEVDRLDAKEQELTDELANHQLELEDRIKVANIGAKHE